MVKAAILGFGVVGAGVAELLKKNAETVASRAGDYIELKYILEIRKMDNNHFSTLFTSDFASIESDDEIKIVIETIGGVGAALDFTRRALNIGKHVVTSNKELVAQYGDELLALAKKRGVCYLFEASVGGGIPILRPLKNCLAANRILEITGVLNGTTNYILSKMEMDDCRFEAALQEARARGYAEANPSDDIEGKDTTRKICILSALAFGRHVYPARVQTEGIANIVDGDMRFAKENGFTIKLLGRAMALQNGRICIYTAPHLIASNSIFARIDGVHNAIAVTGDSLGTVMFYGPGAGAAPTASAVVADLIEAVRNPCKTVPWLSGDSNGTVSLDSLISRWYLRAVNGQAVITPLIADKNAFACENGLGEIALGLRIYDENENDRWM